jgi:putative flavoprotein involved in K+ transport
MSPRPARAARSRARAADVIVIGAGHSGLAMSHGLSARGISHVVIERGEVANSWRRERWDSLRLLTPNWMSRLPGHAYAGNDPDGFMDACQVVAFVADYAAVIAAPVRTHTNVTSVVPDEEGYRVATDTGAWRCRALVVASGAFNVPVVPAFSAAIPKEITQVTPFRYRNARQLPPGGVLVVGASATGLQLAEEIQRAGHEVTLAVGEHVRMPRTYRGRDIQWWMLATGLLDARYDAVDDLNRVRGVAAPQLIGSRERTIVDLNALTAQGVRLVGRLAGVRDGKAQFSGSLRNVCALADLKLERLLGAIDEWAAANLGSLPPPERFEPTRLPEKPILNIDLGSGAIRTIVWATGFRPDYSWLEVPVLDRKGCIRHEGGVAQAPGLYVLGHPFLRRRKSSFIHGAEADAHDLCEHLADWLGAKARAPAEARRTSPPRYEAAATLPRR